jgi:energy-converting hydrogenase Eha subunit E
VDNLNVAAYAVSLVVLRYKHDYAVLDEYVAVPAFNCVAVLDTYNL